MVKNTRRKREKKKPGKRLKPQQWLLDPLWNSLKRSAQSNQVKRGGLVIMVERRGISRGIALRHLICTWLHVWSVKWLYLRRDCPLRYSTQGLDSQGNWDWKCPGDPTQAPMLIIPAKPWVLITVGGQSVNFLLDTGTTFSALTEAPGLLSSWSTTVMGLSGWAKCYYFSHPLNCNWNSVLFSHEFLIRLESPSPLLGRVSDQAGVSLTPSREGILNMVQASVFTNMEPALLIEQNVNPRVWVGGKTVGWAQNAVPVIIKLKDLHLFSHQKQYPLKPEVKEWAKPYCTDFSWSMWDLKL